MADDDLHRTRTEARAGSTPHVVRYILAISLALLILAYIVILVV
jgi:Flp pilus assembly protein TadB